MVSMYGQLTPQIWVCGEAQYHSSENLWQRRGYLTHRAKKQREGQRKEAGNHVNPSKEYLQCSLLQVCPPPFTVSTTPIFHQIINLSMDSSIDERRDLMVQTTPKSQL